VVTPFGNCPWALVRNEEDRVEKIADRQVQQALDGVFQKFRKLSISRQTMLWLRDEKIPLPRSSPAPPAGKSSGDFATSIASIKS